MDIEKKVEILKKTPFFETLSNEEYIKIAHFTEHVKYNSNDFIFQEEDIADGFYILVEGEIEILKKDKANHNELLAIKKGLDAFGEMSIIDDLPRSATIKARTDVEILRLRKENFTKVLQRYANVSYEVAKSVCYNVRNTNETYIRDLEKRNNQLINAYKTLKKTQEDLIKAEKLSVIGKFASLIIHDIKNPMTNIRAYAELCKMAQPEDTKIDKATQIIIKEVDRLVNMTSELLEFARGEMSLNMTPVNINSFITTMIDLIQEDMRIKKIRVTLKDNDDVMAMIDSEKMKRVFFNLVTNAADAIETNGTIEISIKPLENTVQLIFADNGCGMSEETVSNIFEPFYTKKTKGTGLGMAIVKGIVENHNGTIKVKSKEGKGSVFYITLPKV